MRNIIKHSVAPSGHWVGDGFPVKTLFSHFDGNHETSPFLMLDYAGPAHFEPSDTPRGVDVHPHKGFETVTIVYQGEVEHGRFVMNTKEEILSAIHQYKSGKLGKL